SPATVPAAPGTPSHAGRASWLTDARGDLAQGHRLFTAFPGGPLQPTGYRLPARAIDVSVSPDGHHVVYALGCRVWLADLAARTRRIVDRRKVFDTGDWSSDGRHFLLRQGWWANGCRQFEVALWGG